MSDDLKNQVKKKIPDYPTKTMGLYSVVSIAVVAKYNSTTNVNVTDGISNGAGAGLAPNVWLNSSVGRASHRYRGGHGFESR